MVKPGANLGGALPLQRSTLWLLLVLGSLVLLACVSLFAFQASLRAMEERAQFLASSAQSILATSIAGGELLADALGSDDSLRTLLTAPDPATAGAVGDRLDMLRRQGQLEDIFLMDREGAVVAASNWRRDGSFVGNNYGFRSYFRQALSLGEGTFLALGVTSRRVGIYLARPVGRGEGVVVVKMGFGQLEHDLLADTENGGPQYLLTDRHGVIFAGSVPSWRYQTLAPLSPAAREEIERTRQYEQEPLSPLHLDPERDGIYSSLWPFSGLTLPAGDLHYRLYQKPVTDFGWQLTLLIPVREGVPIFWAVFGPALTLTLMVILAGLYFHRQQKRVLQEADRDHLTGLATRRRMQRVIPSLLHSGRRLVLILLDIDHFRQVNEEQGQLEGDQVLAEFGRVLRELTGEQALCVRYGGDEFAIFLPDQSVADAQVLTRQIIEAIGQLSRPDTLSYNLTATLGVSATHPGDTLDTLIQRADGLLFSGKKHGGNRCLFDPGSLGNGRVDGGGSTSLRQVL